MKNLKSAEQKIFKSIQQINNKGHINLKQLDMVREKVK